MDNNAKNQLQPVEIIIIASDEEPASMISQALRNHRIPVHVHRIDDPAQLADTYREAVIDVVLCLDYDPKVNSAVFLEEYKKLNASAGFVIVADDGAEPSGLLRMLKSGARDIISRDDFDHMSVVMQRESSNTILRRQLKETRQQLADAEARCALLLENASEAIGYLADGLHISTNQAYVEIFGYSEKDAMVGMPIMDYVQSGDSAQVKKALKNASKKTVRLDVTLRTEAGEEVPGSLSLSPAVFDEEPCIQILVEKQAPPPTPVAGGSSGSVQFSLEQVKGRLGAEPLALLFIAIDNIRGVRNQIGFGAMPQLLGEIEQRLREILGEESQLAAFSETEFLGMIPNNPATEVLSAKAEQIQQSLEQFALSSEHNLSTLTLSIGIAVSTLGETAEQLIDRALSASDRVFEEGGDNYFLSSGDEKTSDTSSSEDRALARHIQKSLEVNAFRLVFQPIVSMQGDSRENYAVLLRLPTENDKNNEDADLLPHDFLPVADKEGLTVKIDRWVLENAIKELSSQRSLGNRAHFFIVLSEASLLDSQTMIWICDCLEKHETKGNWLTFSFHENLVRKHIKAFRSFAEELKKINCGVSIDHFGLQPKPELLLHHLPIDFIKFDAALMTNLAKDTQNQDRLRILQNLASKYNVKCIAVGIEDASGLAILWSVGISYTQGYFLQEPSEVIQY